MYGKEDKEKLYVVYLKSVIRGIVLSIILLLIASLVFFFSSLNQEYMKTVVWIITILSICYASIYGAFKIGNKGFIHGAFIGGIYIIIMAIIALLSEKGNLNMRAYIIMFVMSLVIGSLAGMIGIVIGNKD
ncbi:MAG: TIGR04086 family membrane protein [Caloramator sp.]|nr:TIGR04086 family membrane protein [Caloramator sp.]